MANLQQSGNTAQKQAKLADFNTNSGSPGGSHHHNRRAHTGFVTDAPDVPLLNSTKVAFQTSALQKKNTSLMPEPENKPIGYPKKKKLNFPTDSVSYVINKISEQGQHTETSISEDESTVPSRPKPMTSSGIPDMNSNPKPGYSGMNRVSPQVHSLAQVRKVKKPKKTPAAPPGFEATKATAAAIATAATVKSAQNTLQAPDTMSELTASRRQNTPTTPPSENLGKQPNQYDSTQHDIKIDAQNRLLTRIYSWDVKKETGYDDHLYTVGPYKFFSTDHEGQLQAEQEATTAQPQHTTATAQEAAQNRTAWHPPRILDTGSLSTEDFSRIQAEAKKSLSNTALCTDSQPYDMQPPALGSKARPIHSPILMGRLQQPPVASMTSQLAELRCIQQDNNHNQVEVPADNVQQVQPEVIISQPDIFFLDQMSDPAPIMKDIYNNVISPNHMANFKAKRLSALQLKTAKAMLNKELQELEYKTYEEMLYDPRTKITPYADHYDEKDLFAPLFFASAIVSSPGCFELFICKACQYEADKRKGFKLHHRSQRHLSSLEEWLNSQKSNQGTQSQTQKISNEAIVKAANAIIHQKQMNNIAKGKKLETEMQNHPRQIGSEDYHAYSKACQTIKECFTLHFDEFKEKIIKLITYLYLDRREQNWELRFNDDFYSKTAPRHWIPEMYDKIKNTMKSRESIRQQIKQNDFSFTTKTWVQRDEIKTISGMATLLFPLLLECKFIPDSYITLLAVLMCPTNFPVLQATSTCLNNGCVIDLLVNTGVAILGPKNLVTTSYLLEAETPPHLPNATWSTDLEAQQKVINDDQTFTSTQSQETFLSSVGQHIDDELLLNQARIQDDINLTNAKGTEECITLDEADWLLDHTIFPNANSSTSSGRSMGQTIHNDIIKDTIPTTDVNANQEIEVVHDFPLKSTIYVPNLPHETTENSLRILLASFGEINSVLIDTTTQPSLTNAIVTFEDHASAKHAMLCINKEFYKHQILKVVMNKRKSFLAYKSQLSMTPILELTKVINRILESYTELPETGVSTPESLPELIDPKTKICHSCLGPAHKQQNCPINKQEQISRSPSQVTTDNMEPTVNKFLQETDQNSTSIHQGNGPTQPNPSSLALLLFQHWEQNLHLRRDIEITHNDSFVNETINLLAILAAGVSPNRSPKRKLGHKF